MTEGPTEYQPGVPELTFQLLRGRRFDFWCSRIETAPVEGPCKRIHFSDVVQLDVR